MNPLFNALLGVLFLGFGAGATVVMYYLQGRATVAGRKLAQTEAKPRERTDARGEPRAVPRKPAPSTTAAAVATIPRHEQRAGQRPTDATVKTETRWYKVAEPGEVADGDVKAAEAGTRTVALTHWGGEYGAIDGCCPHQGGPLTEGTFEDGVLRCPWHGWGFDARTGESADPHHDGVGTYEIEVRDDGIYVAG